MSAHRLVREMFSKSLELDFFSEKELTIQTGYDRADWWPGVLAKELIDNALDDYDAADTEERGPCVIAIQLDDAALIVKDNGRGIRPETVERILDFSSRTSDKAAYVSPARGAQGNALKTVLAIPYVLNGHNPAAVEIEAHGIQHQITVSTDHIAQKVLIHNERAQKVKKPGTSVRIPRVHPCSETQSSERDFLLSLTKNYSLFNPQATFKLRLWNESITYRATNPAWINWTRSEPTSAHWYEVDNLQTLVAAKLNNERKQGGERQSIRDFIAEFRGLKSSIKRTDIIAAAGLDRMLLQDLVAPDGKFEQIALHRLLARMKVASNPVNPDHLGILGEDHFRDLLSGPGFRYKRIKGDVNGLSFVVEAAFCVPPKINVPGMESVLNGLHVGLNWAVPLSNPLQDTEDREGLSSLLREKHIVGFGYPSYCLALHLICPRFTFRDRGKGSVILPDQFADAVNEAVSAVTKEVSKTNKKRDRNAAQAEREDRERERRHANTEKPISFKDAAWKVMEAAYLKTSVNGRWPAEARQIMYVARPLILELTGKASMDDKSFTQTHLPGFMKAHPELTADWDVVYDARGHFIEPHTGHTFGIGTLGVRTYLEFAKQEREAAIALPQISAAFPTAGPRNRYATILYVEKEGFLPLLARAQFAERYDMAIASSKGMGSTSLRTLVEELAGEVTVLVLHDFDKAGFSIVGTLRRNTPRFTFKSIPKIVDIGVRLTDVREWKLQTETTEYPAKEDPGPNLAMNGATAEEIQFLRGDLDEVSKKFKGQRVEINAFPPEQLVAWLEAKLQEHQIKKVVPDMATLQNAYRRNMGNGALQRILQARIAEVQKRCNALVVPSDLMERVMAELERDPAQSWDSVVARLAAEDQKKR